MTEERMKYSKYKNAYSDCQTIPGSYDNTTKTIVVLLPEGRIKKSGVRGQKFKYIWFRGVEITTGRNVEICIKATCKENAIKRLPDGIRWEI